jgi:predicted extracellular nuclease
VGGRLKVASFNVLNYFTTIDDGSNGARGADSEAELAAQTGKLVKAILGMDADILGLVEIENEFAADPGGDGRFAVDFLVNALNVAEGEDVWAFVDPGRARVDVSDAISTAMIYRTDTVAIAQGTTVAILDDTAVDQLALIDPEIDPGHELFDGVGTNRASLAATFTELASGQSITLATNHFKSKGSVSPFGDNADRDDGAAANNEARLQAAKALDFWLAQDPTGAGHDRAMILGDLNAYAKEDPITFLESEGFTDLARAFGGPEAYSYLFDGQLGTLDYAMASDALLPFVTGATEWHINADEIPVFDYNDDVLDFGERSFEEEPDGADLTEPGVFRTSDHDPVLVGLDLGPILVTGGPRFDRLAGTDADEKFLGGGGTDFITTGGGEDIVDLSVQLANGTRDVTFIEDFDVTQDMLGGIGADDVMREIVAGNRTILVLDTRDIVTLVGVTDPSDIVYEFGSGTPV